MVGRFSLSRGLAPHQDKAAFCCPVAQMERWYVSTFWLRTLHKTYVHCAWTYNHEHVHSMYKEYIYVIVCEVCTVYLKEYNGCCILTGVLECAET